MRFKFTAKPKNPSMIQRMAIRRMYESLPKLGIEFAKPPYAAFARSAACDPAARAAAAIAGISNQHTGVDTMEKRKLGNSGLEFAPIAFGGNVFGWTADEATSHKLLDAFVDAGFSFVDTADVYSRWVPGHKGGESEAIIGTLAEEGPGQARQGPDRHQVRHGDAGRGQRCRAPTSRSRSTNR